MKAAGNNRSPASKKAASGSKKTERHVANKIGKVFLTLFLLVVITGSIVVGTLAVYILVFVKPENIDLTNAQLKFTSMIYANDSSGNPQLVSQINGGENRIWVSIDQMPDNLKNAFISTEEG